jgi:AcrR family transcriptional regulator
MLPSSPSSPAVARPARGRPRAFDREAALAAAMRLFWARGYEPTTLEELSAAMGIRQSSLYQAFGSKERLFAEAVALYEARQGGIVARALAEPRLAEAMRALLLGVAEAYAGEHDPPGCLVLLGGTNLGAASAPVAQTLWARRRAAHAAIAARFARAVADGEVSGDADPDALATWLLATMAGLAVMARDGLGKPALMRCAEQALCGLPPLLGSRVPAAVAGRGVLAQPGG